MKNQTGKYFKYAIGEIILVVIGILIALQINNWNEQKNNETYLKSLLVEFKSELNYNVRDFEYESKRAENFVKRNRALLNNKNLESLPLDTLEKHIETFYINFSMNTNVNERFKNSQINNFGKYDSIIYDMQDYYNLGYQQILNNLKSHNEAVDKADEFWRYQQDNFEFRYEEDYNSLNQNPIERKAHLISLIKSPKARNILKIDNRRKEEIIDLLKGYKLGAEIRINKINKILNLESND